VVEQETRKSVGVTTKV